jgi:uncharacterized protein YjbI with pentapeptide repeats
MGKSKNILFSPSIVVLLVAVGFIAALLLNNRTERSNELQKDVSDLEQDIGKLEDQVKNSKSKNSEKTLENSEKALEEETLLSLKKEVATLKKESFLFEEARLLTTVQVISGLAVFGGFFLTWHNQETERKKIENDFTIAKTSQADEQEKYDRDTKILNERLVSERFSDAIELLGGRHSAARLAGVYTLENIAKDQLVNVSSEYKQRVIRVLTAFIKDRSPWFGERDLEAEKKNTPTAVDIKVALEVIHSLWEELPPNKKTLNLSNTKLEQLLLAFMYCWKYLHIESSYLNDIDFTGSNLSDSKFTNCVLIGVVFNTSTLCCTSFKRATLENVELAEANLKSTNFIDAVLENVSFTGADLEFADFTNAVLKAVDFTGAKSLETVNFTDANLENIKGLDLEKIKSSPRKSIEIEVSS